MLTAMFIFLTLPVTTATAERSFNKLKLIKNYLRSHMIYERLDGLSVLSIESDKADEINLYSVSRKQRVTSPDKAMRSYL